VSPITLRTVTASGNTIRFSGRVNDKALRDFIPALDSVVNAGHRDINLDFRRATLAYSETVLPIICLLDHRRERGDGFRVLLPDAPNLRNLFLNTNWAHYMDSDQPKVDLQHPLHVAARRYTTEAEQQSAVTSVLKIVLQSMELDRNVIKALDWSINEVTDNVLNHAHSTNGGLVQASTFREHHRIQFVVADAGRGVPTAMREAFPRVGNDARALEEAVKAGVTSIPESGQGNGLWGTLEIAKCSHGSFKVTSGKGYLNIFRDLRTDRYRQRLRESDDYPGTVVMLELGTDVAFDFEQALNLTSAVPEPIMDVVDFEHATVTGELVVRITEEGIGYGTRQAGVALRQKCLNLLNAEPDRRLVLEWAGVQLVTSSFADEAVGKLFVELGPTVFASRVSHAGTEPVVRSLLDRAVLQRVEQSLVADRAPKD
jgi:anti-sigma regulatory factor (Ser/Thr protein kinase)